MASSHPGLKIALKRIAKEKKEKTGFLNLGKLGLKDLPEELWELRHLTTLVLGSMFRDDEGCRQEVESTGKDNTLSDGAAWPQAGFPQLRGLFLREVKGAAGIAALLSQAPGLTILDCPWTDLAGLQPLAVLSSLQSLDCAGTEVASLQPLAALSSLQSLDCSATQVFSLKPLAALPSLHTLNCSYTKVASVESLAGLSSLHTLDCYNTQVASLEPLAKLTSLQSLDCSRTRIASLQPLAALSSLQSLVCYSIQITSVPPGLVWQESLSYLDIRGTPIPDIPKEILSQSNCLPALRAHFKDLEAGDALVTDVKVLLLGNGLIGKTQFYRSFQEDLPYQPDSETTHGILVSHQQLGENLIHWWDFGGQEIYHGTHALFLKSRAVFFVLWTPESENAATHTTHGITFRNHPLDYWIELVQQTGGPDRATPVLIVQCRCDAPDDEVPIPPIDSRLTGKFAYRKLLHHSSATRRGLPAAQAALTEAISWMRAKQGDVRIGAGRMRVKRRLEAMLAANALLPAGQRQHRLLTQRDFRTICAEEGGVSSPEYLLSYLDDCGIVFHRPGLFDDLIVLDQQWALNAIYTLFRRETCWRHLRDVGGRFTRPLLDGLAWRDHSPRDQELFLTLMESCGLCFKFRTLPSGGHEYLAPDLLPDEAAIAPSLEALWQPGAATPRDAAVTIRIPYLHPGLVTAVISSIGQLAGDRALYWQTGLCGYEARTRSHLLIRAHFPAAAGIVLEIATRGGEAARLLATVEEYLQPIFQRLGCDHFTCDRPASSPPSVPSRSLSDDSSHHHPATMTADFSDPPRPRAITTYAISYAWDQGGPSEKTVDDLCLRAKAKGIEILRDKDHAKFGDDLVRFMRQLAGHDRVLVILSDKYLKSPWCMFELSEIWRLSQHSSDDFRNKVRCYILKDAAISTPAGRLQYAIHWQSEFARLDDLLRQHGPGLLGEGDFANYRLMQKFAHQVGDILHTIATTLQPRSIDDLAAYSFGDP